MTRQIRPPLLRTAIVLASILATPTFVHAGPTLGWTISASPTDPFVHWDSPVTGPGPVTLYLWYACNITGTGLAATEMGVGGTLVPQTFTPLNGFVSAGTPSEILIAVGGCPSPPVLAGAWTVTDPGGGGTLFVVPSSNNRVVTVACGGIGYSPDWIGFASDGSTPASRTSCDVDICCLLPPGSPPTGVDGDVEGFSWGHVKARYR